MLAAKSEVHGVSHHNNSSSHDKVLKSLQIVHNVHAWEFLMSR